jgi:hypothetical protein
VQVPYCPIWSVSRPDLLQQDFGLNVPANGFDRDSTSIEDASRGRRAMEFCTPESHVAANIDIAMNLKILTSIVLKREVQTHA